jgi:GntR family transcriptional regulator
MFQVIADDLRQKIRTGVYPPGFRLPGSEDMETQYHAARETIQKARNLLAAEGLIWSVPKAGTVVQNQGTVPVRYSRYRRVLDPSPSGPWEVACAEAGVPGEMVMIAVLRTTADERAAAALGIPEGDPVICRRRHADIGDTYTQPVQLQTAVYPAALVAGTPIAAPGKITGGVYAALKDAGIPPVAADETVIAREPTREEARDLHLKGRPVLVIDRVTRDATGRPLEALRVVADPVHTTLVYDSLPLNGTAV